MTSVLNYICHSQTNAKHRNLLEEICNSIDRVSSIIVIFLVGGVGRTFGIYLAPIGGERVTCHWSNSPDPWEKKDNFRLARDQVLHLEIAANVLFQLASRKYFFSLFFSSFGLGGETKYLMTHPSGKVCFKGVT